MLAAILSTISFYWYFVEPVRTIYINRSEIPYFVIFTAFAALLSRFGTFRQRAEADLRRTHDQLKVERPKLGSRTIALLYFAFSSCWILFTDRLVHGLGLSNAYLLKVSEAKGILFISLSTLLMYVLVERALRQRHSVATAYWQLVETAQEGVWSVDAEGKTVFANENMAAILGTSPGEMIGKSILPFVPQEKKDELLNHLLQREQGLQEHYEFPFRRADGAQVWTLLRVSPVLRDGQHSGCLALVSDITELKHAEEALLEERVRERTRIARELHDTLLQSFHGVLFKFQAASNLFSKRPDDAKRILDRAIDEADKALTEGRDAIQGLRSSSVETNDLDAAIRTLGAELAADQSNHSSAVFQVAVVGTPQELSPRLRDEVYSIAAEGLRNAFRHAEARQIEVEIRYGEPQFRLRVRDDGRGIDPKVLAEGERAGHWGLYGMRERAKLVGSNLSVRSELGSGTEIELSTPASAAYAAFPRRSRLSAKSSGKGTDVGEAETKMKS